jgi:glutaredoxin
VNIELTLIGKPGCHLCEDAESAVDRVLAPFLSANPSVAVSIARLNILDDAELAARYSEEIPVLLINGKVHNYWRIDEERFAAALNDIVAEAAKE